MEEEAEAYKTMEIISGLKTLLMTAHDRIEIYRDVAEKIRRLIGDGIVVSSIPDESMQIELATSTAMISGPVNR